MYKRIFRKKTIRDKRITSMAKIESEILEKKNFDQDEKEWIQISRHFLSEEVFIDPEEDIYSIHDGEPLNNEK